MEQTMLAWANFRYQLSSHGSLFEELRRQNNFEAGECSWTWTHDHSVQKQTRWPPTPEKDQLMGCSSYKPFGRV